ncbi:MAG TPA: hypothetical protein VG184_02335 [Acidimicrobiales bacterium]|jgi:hypothetical protein|nr:hypothetical protein [Acidimicrobiales bacterium]
MSVTDTLTSTAQTIQAWSLSALKTSDEAIVDATKAVAGAFEPVVSRARTAPLAAYLPEPAAVVGRWFDFVETVVAEQKRFTLDLTGALAAAAPAASAPKASATKPRAK